MLVAPTLAGAATKLKPKRAPRRVHEARKPVGPSADRRNWRLRKSRPGVVDPDTSFAPDANLARLNQ
jgi:hypothetical protein